MCTQNTAPGSREANQLYVVLPPCVIFERIPKRPSKVLVAIWTRLCRRLQASKRTKPNSALITPVGRFDLLKPTAVVGRAPPPPPPPLASSRALVSVALLSVEPVRPVGFGMATRPDRAGFPVAAVLALDSRALSVLARSLIPPLPPSCGGRQGGGVHTTRWEVSSAPVVRQK